jgi:biopolymer transport protein ExbB/TolQ
MSTATTRKSAAIQIPPDQTDWGAALLLSPWLWGTALTVGFYQALPSLPIDQAFVDRYFRSHWTLYCEMACFFLGICVLARKGILSFRESRSLRARLIDQAEIEDSDSTTERAAKLWQSALALPVGLRRTLLFDRLREVCRYISSRGSARGLEEQLRYLAELAAGNLGASYAIVRTITWAIPILGFLGTVIGITMAIANITPEQLGSSLTGVTAGLAVAFDTTALALTLSMILVFGTFVVERIENGILSGVEQLGSTEIAPLFTLDESPEVAPLVAAEAEAASQLLKRTEALVTWQTGLWQSALENMRGRWMESADQQQSQFTRALEQGMSDTLAGHHQQLSEVRAELISGCHTVALEMARVVEGLEKTAEERELRFVQRIDDVWGRMHEEMARARDEHAARMAQGVESLSRAIGVWHNDLAAATAAMSAQLVELQRQGATLQAIAGQEHDLVRLQATLNQNMQSVRMVEKFEESILNLNAAVHMLTARARPHAA